MMSAFAKRANDSVVLVELERRIWSATDAEIKRVKGEAEEATCAICLDNMQAESSVRMECGHCSHTSCALASERHAILNRSHFRCPECRCAVSLVCATFLAGGHAISRLNTSPDAK